jgi:ribonuclease-3
VPGSVANERLEFLGDAVLGLAVAEHCFRSWPGMPEGDLARVRAAVVSEEALAPVASALGVGSALLLGRGEASSGGREKASILADALEAIIAAAYLAGGLESARSLVLALLGDLVDDTASARELGDPKNRLQELSARLGCSPPVYEVRESGPDHAKRYEAEVRVGRAGGVHGGVAASGHGSGRSKKAAERAAAAVALDRLSVDGA